MDAVSFSATWARIFVAVVALSLPRSCFAYVTWGDFHVFAVIFFTFLGGFLGLGAIFGAIYFACGKSFLNRHQEQVAQTHREHHPWPSGSARWNLQQIIKSERRTGSSVSDGQSRFPVQKPRNQHERLSRSNVGYPVAASGAYYADETSGVPPTSLYQRALDYCGAIRMPDRQPIIAGMTPTSADTQRAAAYALSHERPTYFTPSEEKLMPIHEEFEKCHVTREESFVSSTIGGQNALKPTAEEASDNIHQQQPSRHQLQTMQKTTTTTTTTHTSRRRSPQSAGHAPNTYI